MNTFTIHQAEDCAFRFDLVQPLDCPVAVEGLSFEDEVWRRISRMEKQAAAAKSLVAKLNRVYVLDQADAKLYEPQSERTAVEDFSSEWEFRPGTVKFGNRQFRLSGKKWELLKAFASARWGVTADDLWEELWDGREIARKSLRTEVSNLRILLRKEFDLDDADDPLPHLDQGALLAWRLDESLLKKPAQNRP